MRARGRIAITSALAACALLAGCRLPGKPRAGDTPQRPDQITNFKTIYGSNCAACHGAEGKHGMAVSLANPAYLAYAGENNIAEVTAKGVDGFLMPAFAKSSGGLLTDQQIRILAHGMVSEWGDPAALHGGTPPPYHSTASGNAEAGEQVYRTSCLSCHGAARGSVLDSTYLALISDGGLRTILVAGKTTQGMPDWQDYKAGALTDQSIADVVAFMAAHRTPKPGQPFPNPHGEYPDAPPQAQPANPLAPPESAAQGFKDASR